MQSKKARLEWGGEGQSRHGRVDGTWVRVGLEEMEKAKRGEKEMGESRGYEERSEGTTSAFRARMSHKQMITT